MSKGCSGGILLILVLHLSEQATLASVEASEIRHMGEQSTEPKAGMTTVVDGYRVRMVTGCDSEWF